MPIHYERHPERFTDYRGVSGLRGTIWIGPMFWPAIERGPPYKWLRPGLYDCELGYWTSSNGAQAQAVRVLGDYSQGRIYIHPANWPHQLTGCISPGIQETDAGVGNSREAMREIFDALGGFHENHMVRLEVSGDAIP